MRRRVATKALKVKTVDELEAERISRVLDGWFCNPPAPRVEPFLQKVNREKELARLLGARSVTVVWTYPACVGKLEEISYYTNDIPDPIILVSWWSTAEKFNETMAAFQRLRRDGGRLANEGIKFWEGKILPEAILAEFNRDQIKFIKEWVFDILQTRDVIPTPERRPFRLARYSWLNMEEW